MRKEFFYKFSNNFSLQRYPNKKRLRFKIPVPDKPSGFRAFRGQKNGISGAEKRQKFPSSIFIDDLQNHCRAIFFNYSVNQSINV